MNTIQNPILSGFHPDPSIIRVGEDYYIAVSTFEWFPGICIYHSKDLQNWELISRPLNRTSQLDMKGNDASGGIFAPCLSYDNGMFYLVYTNVRTHWYEFMDCHNYLVTATNIRGEWSEPIYLHSFGFDPSLFHDTDGRKWIVSIERHYREKRTQQIVLQEYDPIFQKMTGELKEIYAGSGISAPEGPHLYKRNGYYYLLCAEGGTEYGHAVTMARSKSLWGPYENHPGNPILTSRYNLGLPLQKAGHADLVEACDGEWYMVHLCGRPLPPFRRCPLGRETAIQHVRWQENGWLIMDGGGNEPKTEVAVSWPISQITKKEILYRFDHKISPDFHSLRIPLDQSASLTEKPGSICLIGKDSPNSRFEQTLLARRQEDFHFLFETEILFDPVSERQMAGILYYYDECDFYYLRITCDREGNKVLDIMVMEHGKAQYELTQCIPLPTNETVLLRLEVNDTKGQFSYSVDNAGFTNVGTVFDASKISDDYPLEGAYTGAMIGLGCHDMAYRNAKAYFSYASYTSNPPLPSIY